MSFPIAVINSIELESDIIFGLKIFLLDTFMPLLKSHKK